MKILRQCIWKLQDRKAQILLPSVLLAPIFVLVIYLLFETAKVSMSKVRQQFALDNAAYSQMSSASTYLNAVAMVNGPLPYRVMLQETTQKLNQKNHDGSQISVFDVFYKGGAFPTIGPDYETGVNDKPPAAEAVDWGIRYYEGNRMENDRKDWMKETPTALDTSVAVPIVNKYLVENYYFPGEKVGIPAIVRYLTTYARVGSIYKSQSYVYKELSKNAVMFREAYYLNVNDCKRSECARQSAAQIRQFTSLSTIPFELAKVKFFISEATTKEDHHGGSFPVETNTADLLDGELLYQFAYLNPSSSGKLRTLSRGILLKQPFKLPRNHFNINLEQKYKPYVRNRVRLLCPRSDNNCVWPHPLPKYGIKLEP